MEGRKKKKQRSLLNLAYWKRNTLIACNISFLKSRNQVFIVTSNLIHKMCVHLLNNGAWICCVSVVRALLRDLRCSGCTLIKNSSCSLTNCRHLCSVSYCTDMSVTNNKHIQKIQVQDNSNYTTKQGKIRITPCLAKPSHSYTEEIHWL